MTANFADVGGSSAESAGTRVTIRGGSNGDTTPLLDGLKVGNLFVGAGQVNILPLNPLLTQVNSVKHVWDVNGAFGGPIMRDRLWFYMTERDNSYANLIAGQYFTQDISE